MADQQDEGGRGREVIWRCTKADPNVTLSRTRVPGGWIYIHSTSRHDGSEATNCMAFVPASPPAAPTAMSRVKKSAKAACEAVAMEADQFQDC